MGRRPRQKAASRCTFLNVIQALLDSRIHLECTQMCDRDERGEEEEEEAKDQAVPFGEV
jgi:hypothetical protein